MENELGTTPESVEPTPVTVVDTPAPTLRETIAEQVDKVEAASPKEPVKTDDRPRGPDGKFLPKEAAPDKPPEPVITRPKPPTSWKKDYLTHWDTLDPKLAEYMLQREQEFAKGVSTYKTEWEQTKPLSEAMAPFLPELQQHGIDPGRWITNLGNAHRSLAKGTPEQKLSMFLKLAQDYQVPVQNLFAQGQDGKVYFNPQVQPYQAPPQTPDYRAVVQKEMGSYFATVEVDKFGNETDATGNPAHPHYATVKETMAQLLEAGLADDLKGAYEAALRHPRHADIFETIQTEKAEKDAAEKAKKLKDEADRARRDAVSTKSATPKGKAPSGKKGLRSTIEEAFETHDGGRV